MRLLVKCVYCCIKTTKILRHTKCSITTAQVTKMVLLLFSKTKQNKQKKLVSKVETLWGEIGVFLFTSTQSEFYYSSI